MASPTYRAELGIEGDLLVPNDLTDALGIPPDRSFHRGQVGPSGKPRPFGGWYLKGPAESSADLAIESLLVRLHGSWKPSVVIGLDAYIDLLGLFPEDYGAPHMELSAATIARVSEMGVALVFDSEVDE